MAHQDNTQNLSDISGSLSNRGYSIIRKLGEGTYAKVYMATYTDSNDPSGTKTPLACKIVDTTKAPRDFVRKFLPRELDVLKRISHPHIVHIHAIYQRRSRFLIFMRLAENGDLLEWVVRYGPVGEDQSRVWLRQLALAVQYLQALDIAHRDLKCENILITAHCNCKLADFGFARSVVDNRGRRILCATNCGSLSYAAPEILGGNPYDPRISDIWSLGVVLFIMLNKAMPFNDDNIQNLYREQVKQLVQNMLEPETQRRYVVGQVLSSQWLAMDQRLAAQTAAEARAINNAMRDRELRHAQQDGLRPPEQAPAINLSPATAVSAVDEHGEEPYMPMPVLKQLHASNASNASSTDISNWSACPEPEGTSYWEESEPEPEMEPQDILTPEQQQEPDLNSESVDYSDDILGYMESDPLLIRVRPQESSQASQASQGSVGSIPSELGTE